MIVTIFDSIKYPIAADPKSISCPVLAKMLPEEIYQYWYGEYFLTTSLWEANIKDLKRLIAEYNTDKCEITKSKQNDNI